MKVKQALKQKKKLATKMNQEFVRVNMYNSVEEGATRVYDVKASMQNWLKMIDELVELKTKIHLANVQMVLKIEEEIERLQEELDEHNATTSI